MLCSQWSSGIIPLYAKSNPIVYPFISYNRGSQIHSDGTFYLFFISKWATVYPNLSYILGSCDHILLGIIPIYAINIAGVILSLF